MTNRSSGARRSTRCSAYQTVWDWDPEAGYHPHTPAFVRHQPGPAQRPFPY